MNNILIAACTHAATKTMEARINMSVKMIQNIVEFYEGTYPVSRVN